MDYKKELRKQKRKALPIKKVVDRMNLYKTLLDDIDKELKKNKRKK